jgi:hypothetical protein
VELVLWCMLALFISYTLLASLMSLWCVGWYVCGRRRGGEDGRLGVVSCEMVRCALTFTS